MRFQNGSNKVVIELRVVQFWSEIIHVILKSHVWFQPKLHSTQCNYHYEVTFHIAIFMYKFKNQLLPTNFNVFFTSIKETHNYNTRLSSRMTYAQPKTRTNYGIFNIRYQGAKIWNAISDNIKLLSLKQFKKKLKSNIIASY